MIYIISNGEYPSDHTLYFVKAASGYDFRAWFLDLVNFDVDGYRKFQNYEIVGVIKGSLELEGSSYEVDYYTAKAFAERLFRYSAHWPSQPNDSKYLIAKAQKP